MKIRTLSKTDDQPSLCIHFRGATVLFDLPLDTRDLLDVQPLGLSLQSHSLPSVSIATEIATESATESATEKKQRPHSIDKDPFDPHRVVVRPPSLTLIDPSDVCAVFISNWMGMLALPYLTEYTAFRGSVYATEPTLQYGRLAMEELVAQLRTVQSENEGRVFSSEWLDAGWKEIYSALDVTKCVNRVQSLSFNEDVNILSKFNVRAVASGYLLGSSNWLIRTDYEKISVITNSSSASNRYPLPFNFTPVSRCNVSVMTAFTNELGRSLNTTVEEFCKYVATTINANGSVLLPTSSCGLALDILEILLSHLSRSVLMGKPIYFVSPSAKGVIEYGHILGEWMAQHKRDRIYMPLSPFIHKDLIHQGAIECVPELSSRFVAKMKEPCIVITGHPSLRFGDVVAFINLWKHKPENTMILTDPAFEFERALAPHKPMAMTCVSCPIDMRLNFVEATALMQRLQADTFVIPSKYMVDQGPTRAIPPEIKAIGIEPEQGVSITLKRTFTKAFVSPELALSMDMKQYADGKCAGRVKGVIRVKHDTVHVEPAGLLDQHLIRESELSSSSTTGIPSENNIQDYLRKLGIQDYKVDLAAASGSVLTIPAWKALIRWQVDGKVEIECKGALKDLAATRKLVSFLFPPTVL
eukprot:TRINITY_DN4141_c0_g1_i3.p1 TRINITY_DN4141_c0_g1~~TRINITY_DN4141_c0_g1_i3.p1  ORF type:complete len:642 (-),score=117.12 TRINITY_DN4141_c0_g1_i3:215-2140(-)